MVTPSTIAGGESQGKLSHLPQMARWAGHGGAVGGLLSLAHTTMGQSLIVSCFQCCLTHVHLYFAVPARCSWWYAGPVFPLLRFRVELSCVLQAERGERQQEAFSPALTLPHDRQVLGSALPHSHHWGQLACASTNRLSSVIRHRTCSLECCSW